MWWLVESPRPAEALHGFGYLEETIQNEPFKEVHKSDDDNNDDKNNDNDNDNDKALKSCLFPT